MPLQFAQKVYIFMNRCLFFLTILLIVLEGCLLFFLLFFFFFFLRFILFLVGSVCLSEFVHVKYWCPMRPEVEGAAGHCKSSSCLAFELSLRLQRAIFKKFFIS